MSAPRSGPYSPASAVSISASNAPAGSAGGKSSSTTTASVSSPSTGRPSRSGATSETSPTSRRSSSSVAGSPVSPYPSSAKGLAKKTPDGSGLSLRDSFAYYDRRSSCWRTSQGCLFAGLDPFSETWPRAGTTRSGTAFLRPPLVPLIAVTGCSSWPTPLARDEKGAAQRARYGDESSLPAAIGGAPNPTWLEWLLGFPPGWTLVSRAREPSATPSSPRSPSGSAGDYSKRDDTSFGKEGGES